MPALANLGSTDTEHRCTAALPVRVALVVAAAFVSACVTVPQGGSALPGVNLVANGREVVLTWTAESLLTRPLRPGVSVELVAEYSTSAGRVTGEPLSAARVTADANVLRLALPDSLRNPPTGGVCLRLRVNGRNALPLRAGGAESSTDGFQHMQWGREVTLKSFRRALVAERESLAISANNDRSAVGLFATWKQQRQVGLAADCNRLAPSAVAGQRPRNVLDPAEHAMASRRECVWRYKKLFQDKDGSQSARLADQFQELFEKEFRAEVAKGVSPSKSFNARKLAQAQLLRSAIREQHASTGSAFRPLLLEDELALTSSVESERERQGVTPAVASGILDAFESCLGDSGSQFKLSLESWQREQDPRLQASRVEVLRGECRARFAEEERRSERVARRASRLPQIESELAGLPGLSNSPLPTTVALIGQTCDAN